MIDPFDEVLAKLAQLRRVSPELAPAVAQDLAAEIAQRFLDGRAPVLSGRLADSIRVAGQDGLVRVSSAEPYAQRHPEILPTAEEIDKIIQRAADRLVGG